MAHTELFANVSTTPMLFSSEGRLMDVLGALMWGGCSVLVALGGGRSARSGGVAGAVDNARVGDCSCRTLTQCVSHVCAGLSAMYCRGDRRKPFALSTGHENACNSVVFTPSGETMLSTDADGMLCSSGKNESLELFRFFWSILTRPDRVMVILVARPAAAGPKVANPKIAFSARIRKVPKLS